jgi:hypothetical protein
MNTSEQISKKSPVKTDRPAIRLNVWQEMTAYPVDAASRRMPKAARCRFYFPVMEKLPHILN